MTSNMTRLDAPAPMKPCDCDRKREDLEKAIAKVHRHAAALEGALREVRVLLPVACDQIDKAA